MISNFGDPTHGEDRDDPTENEVHSHEVPISKMDPDKLRAKLEDEIARLTGGGKKSEDFKDSLNDLLKDMVKQMQKQQQNKNGDHVIFDEANMQPTAVVIDGKKWPIHYDCQGAAEDKLDDLANQLIDHCSKNCLPVFMIVQTSQNDVGASYKQTVSVPGPRCSTALHMAVRIASTIMRKSDHLSPAFLMQILSQIQAEAKKRSEGDDE